MCSRGVVVPLVLGIASGACRGRGERRELSPPLSASTTSSSIASASSSASGATHPTEANPDAPPPGLACLSRWYAGRAEKVDGAWGWTLPDGARVAWDDGRSKTFDEMLERPDVQDVYAIPYVTGAIAKVTTIDHDPGRVRVDAIFAATYGASATAVGSALLPFPLLGVPLVVHHRAHDAFVRVSARLDALVAKDPSLAPFLRDAGGTFVWRPIAGTDRRSAHSYGIALDISVPRSDYWRSQLGKGPLVWRNKIPQPIVDAFEAESFVWGGRWYHYDTMHFEWRPELFDPSCRPDSGP
jgi:hypothetical protein